ncbi:MAG: hypothetical protein A2725_01505 [Candidatus Magasanikbacteria bacterium RIFCSPHIGHO2_01_FULL_33_34]|uniref:Uncharacterized protein n=1 Tax=Candidatus Magasanikbacteria bacterium RIFCSPHIGHO2_01_FULL_33_34 TaxID=1798671 RepID=A0A1F6LJA2_9BACT|nr:MAG: hypothetical protein A2725_01505 [Candidatus Magasanikbacteria bacterium RIFCSPHIGHO2_01_FULL_33_34]OGH65489.1 MAG: hypothetical protein A3B83_01260 [Candidatus Magasanikbacteria bacterium RIFCSPHIGHO2_02_FULL_33_17]OGH76199.1 MAG: hypothetical protein A3A89_02080 [Candidatus Magasanikbacteria bacterium RIFCSPLOWO2_01_FULL_33_34]OGH82605.1 MAG: hypothetical protein A3F93_04815 [Candidatus Magasanikbacteria bacterium RIFCSPLOWO2_12_FULL_34_7]
MRDLIASPFVWIDQLIQKGVDSVMFFLMRMFGLRKSIIKYIITSLFIIGLIGMIIYDFQQGHVVQVCLGVLWLFCSLIVQHINYYDDVKDENSNTVYFRSDLNLIKFDSIIKIFCIFHISEVIFFGIDVQSNFYIYSHNITFFSFLLLVYIAKTPNTPPPQEKKVTKLVHAHEPA